MIVALVCAALYLVMFGVVLQRSSAAGRVVNWMAAFCGYSAALAGFHTLWQADRLNFFSADTQQLIVFVGFILSVCLTGSLTFLYTQFKSSAYWWAVPAGVWSVLAVITFSVIPGKGIILPALHIEVLMVGWLIAAAFLLTISSRAFLQATLPLVANRMLLWMISAPLILVGDALSALLNTPWSYLGYGVRLLGTFGAVYSIASSRTVDVRAGMRWLLNRAVLILLTAVLAFGGAAMIAFGLPPDVSDVTRWTAVIGVAILIALLNLPLQSLASWIMHIAAARQTVDPTEAIRLYGQQIGGVIELRDLATVAVRAMNRLLSTRRGYLILARQGEEAISLEIIGGGRSDVEAGKMVQTSPIYKRFVSSSHPLLQYDLTYQREFQDAPPEEITYFNLLETDIYAPIINQSQLVGIFALGPKTNDEPFAVTEIELLEALAQQTVAALANARLVSDLRGLNERIRLLNEDLRSSNERLERLDSVKSDFISIASHELRTPLTQIQGYADLVHEMANRGMLDQQQIIDMTTRLIAASQRMAEVLNSLMDVTEIDVENLDLTFGETNLDRVVGLAVAPYEGAIQERKLTLMVKGLRYLPSINGDSKRLTQAFQNIVNNAIKYTPDGGKITISGQVMGKNSQGEPLGVQISVEDTGIGIDKDSQSLVFEKFFRLGPVELHSTGATKFKGAGPGLGLSIAKGVIEGHGGRIWVESEGYNEERLLGTTFHIALPIHPPAMGVQDQINQMKSAKLTVISGRLTDHLSTHSGDKPGQLNP
jgi:signal transduction histidine kinase